MEILHEIQNRFSAEGFSEGEPESDAVDRILEAGRLAPSAKNRQAWRFVAIREKALKEQFEEACFGLEKVGQAGMIIAVCTTNTQYRMSNGQYSYPIDCSFAASFMMLQAQHEGLGSCIVTTYDEARIKEILSVPFSMRVVMLLLVGTPLVTEMERKRNDPRRVISHDHW